MNYVIIRDQYIEKKLKELFGDFIAGTLLMKGMGAARKGANDKERVELLVNEICSDVKVVKMLGESQAKRQAAEWIKLMK